MDWDNRELCPDGACIGVIRTDGTCTVCGRAVPNWGDERRRGMVGEAPDADAAAAPSPAGDVASEPPLAAVAEVPVERPTEGSDDWEDRALCPDGGCTGVINPGTNRCSVCHRGVNEILDSLT